MEETVTTHQAIPEPDQSMVLTPEAQYFLNEGAGWAKFLGITGFVLTGFILLAAIFAGSLFSYLNKISPNPNNMPPGAGVIITVMYGFMSLLYFFPSLYIFQFGTNAKKGILFSDSADITVAVTKLKSFLKFWGVLTIIALAFFILGMIGLFAGIASMQHLK